MKIVEGGCGWRRDGTSRGDRGRDPRWADVIYQETLAGAGDAAALLGRPDFLVRSDLLPALPEPVTGDLFFDIEGARYYSERTG